MTEIIYYVAASLDGYIATPDGGVDWLSAYNTEGEDYGYAAFYQSVDALIEGRKTYEQALGFGKWPHPGKPCWVCTRRALETCHPEVRFTSGSPERSSRSCVGAGCVECGSLVVPSLPHRSESER